MSPHWKKTLFGLSLILCSWLPIACATPPASPVTPFPTLMRLADAPTITPTPHPIPTLFPTATPYPTPSPTPTATPCPPSQMKQTTFPSATTGSQRPLRLYLPPCYGQDNRVYPVLYIFHGNVMGDERWDLLGLDEAANTAINNQLIPPLIIAMPNGTGIADYTSGGPGSYETVILDELIPFVETELDCVWTAAAGRAIGGLSRGGYWALEIAFRHPQQFASVGGHSAALLDTAAGPHLNPQYTALSNDLGPLRIYLDIGDNDYLRTNTIRLHDDMAAANIPHQWHLNPGAHNEDYWSSQLTNYLLWYTEPWPTDRQKYPPC
ncbi:MAG TPA: alpha/beta hydrolase-fold protein [Anaerolineae bacterium]|nr:alpha/beta hydrolase-fold protein [Anaerolineae bacterium]